MDSDRAIQETVARCVSLLVYYRNCGRTAQAREVMEADVDVIASWVAEAGLSREAVGRAILVPVLAELIERYGRQAATDLSADFIAALQPGKSPEPSGEHLVYQG
jgi:hypothetical protein